MYPDSCFTTSEMRTPVVFSGMRHRPRQNFAEGVEYTWKNDSGELGISSLVYMFVWTMELEWNRASSHLNRVCEKKTDN